MGTVSAGSFAPPELLFSQGREMRKAPNPFVEAFRITTGPMASDRSYGNNGAFRFYHQETKAWLAVIASDQLGWDHVSIHVTNEQRCPTWEEMCYVKDLFFRDDELVIQFHPPKEDYVSRHPTTLHLWRSHKARHPLPPKELV